MVAMGGVTDDYMDSDDEEFQKILQQSANETPFSERPSKRRRIDSDIPSDIEDFIHDEDEPFLNSTSRPNSNPGVSRLSQGGSNEYELPRRSRTGSVTSANSHSGAEDEPPYNPEDHVKAKSRYLIHEAETNDLPETQVDFVSQLPPTGVEPQSSPSAIRGPRWVFHRPPVPEPTASRAHIVSQPTANGVTLYNGNVRTRTPSTASAAKTASREYIFNPGVGTGRRSPITVNGPPERDISHELDGLDDADFISSQEGEAGVITLDDYEETPIRPPQRVVAPTSGLRQQTLFGGAALSTVRSASQANKVHNFSVDQEAEPPTHHKLDNEALKTWVYPTNLGTIRDYQYTIVSNALYNNTLVALPTGLGKTFIAATVMLNFFRWYPNSQMVFMAPTKPLVAQQVDACFNIVGIPRSTTTMLNGEVPKAVREEEWQEKRVFFMTPQTLENDLRTGIADPKKIALLVVDEAHRAKGNYAYVKVIEAIRRHNKSFRVLALTATPGADVEAVQAVIDNLGISKIEIRTEESIDIRPFVHRRDIDEIELDPSDEMIMVRDLMAKAAQPLLNMLCSQNAYYNKDPLTLTQFGLVKHQKQWMASDTGRRANQGLKYMMGNIFQLLIGVAHALKLLNYHGMGPFLVKAKALTLSYDEGGAKNGKYKTQLVDSPDFKKMMERVQMWTKDKGFVGHPKLTYLCDTLLNHFMDAGDGAQRAPGSSPSKTRAIVFCEYRESAEEICRVLNRHKPLIRASVFVGQADTKSSNGMTQDIQQKTIKDFQSGKHNVIVATSIGEEGLDIGQVDLIVCYDSSASPIRMLQRMGRTGRKRAGHVVLLLMRGKEKESFTKSKDGYEKMQQMICNGSRFAFRHDLSQRIVPRSIKPVVDKKDVEIPFENTQNTSLPEPKRRARGKKGPAKKKVFQAPPEGAMLGFVTGSNLLDGNEALSRSKPKRISELDPDQLVAVPTTESVLLSVADTEELIANYQNVPGDELQEVGMPEFGLHPASQRILGGGIRKVDHGATTKRFVAMLQQMHNKAYLTPAARHLSQYAFPEAFISSSPPKPKHVVISREDPLDRNSEDESELELPSRKTSNQKGKARARRGRKAANRSVSDGESVDNSADELDSADEDDHGSDLRDWLVEDDEDVPHHQSMDPLPMASDSDVELASEKSNGSPVISKSPKHTALKPFYEPLIVSATQETNDDDEMPDIGTLLGRGKTFERSIASPQKDCDGRRVNETIAQDTFSEPNPILQNMSEPSEDEEPVPVVIHKTTKSSSKPLAHESSDSEEDSLIAVSSARPKPANRAIQVLNSDSEGSATDDAYYDVEYIVKAERRKHEGKLQWMYFVHWLGCASTDDSWITKEQFGASSTMVDEWHRAHEPRAKNKGQANVPRRGIGRVEPVTKRRRAIISDSDDDE